MKHLPVAEDKRLRDLMKKANNGKIAKEPNKTAFLKKLGIKLK